MTKYSKFLTLDWDNISIAEAKRRFMRFVILEEPIDSRLCLSPLKGFHVSAEFATTKDNWKLRDVWKDDGNRLVHEIMGESDKDANGKSMEFLWEGKILRYGNDKFITFRETSLMEY